MTNYFVTNFAGGHYYDHGSYYYDDVLMFVPETSEWKKIGSMRTARSYHGASLVKMDDVLAYVPETSEWKKVESMKTARAYHGASLVKMEDVIDYCN